VITLHELSFRAPVRLCSQPSLRRCSGTAGGAYVPTFFVGMYAPHEGYNLRVPKLQHYYGLNHLHYLTRSTYRRAPTCAGMQVG
jgi:hypothetical protein